MYIYTYIWICIYVDIHTHIYVFIFIYVYVNLPHVAVGGASQPARAVEEGDAAVRVEEVVERSLRPVKVDHAQARLEVCVGRGLPGRYVYACMCTYIIYIYVYMYIYT